MATSTETASQPPADVASYPIKVYNTLSKVKEDFVPVEPGKVGIYLCGPTVYKEAHIGHLVGPVIFDTIARYLTYSGYEVTLVVNITDVDDKLIQQSIERGIPMSQVATEMTADYCANLLEVGVTQITTMPRATENMDEIIRFIEELIEKGFAYEADGDVFFDVARDEDYGKLTNRSAADQEGAGGEAAGKKRSPSDFALWKSAKQNEPSWESPWGPGRPGWHIECSAMSRRLLGKTFDIHGGGLDLTFPHHENEIAQSESCHSAAMAKYWMHNGLLSRSDATGKMGGRSERESDQAASQGADDAAGKMSRSKGAGGLRTLLAEQGGELIRFFLLRTHYRSTILYGDVELADARTALDKFYGFFDRYERITGTSYYEANENQRITRRHAGELDPGDSPLLAEIAKLRTQYLAKMDDDFNTGGAVSELFVMLSALNRFADENQLEDEKQRSDSDLAAFLRGTETLRELSSILGLFIRPNESRGGGGDDELLDQTMQLLIELRAEARKNKDFATADRIRDGLAAIGVTIEDRKDGSDWKVE